MGRTTFLGLAAIGLIGFVGPAAAQVVYQPYVPTAPTPYGYPVPYGYLQPNDVLGARPSYEIFPNAYGYAPAVRVVQRCQYPNGWNATDAYRDMNGIPAGINHTCPLGAGTNGRVRARF